MRILFEELLDGQDHARGAIAALEGVFLFEGMLDRVIAPQALNGSDLASIGQGSQENAGRDWYTIDKGGTGSAYPDATGLANTPKAKVTTQHL
jgi:hypothetical protein